MSKTKNGACLIPSRIPASPGSAVLVVHGGAATSTMPVSRFTPAVLRLIPVAWAVGRGVRGAAVYRLRLSVRGWNGTGADVLRDARWALQEIADSHPGLPIVVVGHSLGGRLAMRLAARTSSQPRPGVVGAVGLAPWVEPNDPVTGLRGVPLFVVQGTADRVVPEPSTRPWLARAGQAGAQIESTLIEGGEHAMLRHLRRWHRLTVDGVRSVLSTAAGSVESVPAPDDAERSVGRR